MTTAGMTKRAVAVMAMTLSATVAQAQGLTKAKAGLLSFQSELMTIVPVVAALALVVFAILWALKVMHFQTFITWAAALVIAGSAPAITALFL